MKTGPIGHLRPVATKHCGSCGLMVTAEHKVNRFGSRYIYYHCTKRNNGPRCSEQSVEGKDLEEQLAAFIGRVAIDDVTHQRLVGQTARESAASSFSIDT